MLSKFADWVFIIGQCVAYARTRLGTLGKAI
jgi:hypothetical protein